MDADPTERCRIEDRTRKQSFAILRRPLGKYVRNIYQQGIVGEVNLWVGHRNRIPTGKNHPRTDPLNCLIGSLHIEAVLPSAVKIGFVKTLTDANRQHFG